MAQVFTIAASDNILKNMFKLGGIIKKDNRIIAEAVATDGCETKSRTKKVLDCLNEICMELNLQVPIWLDCQIREFQRSSRTSFGRDSFIEETDFDFLEIQVLEE